jgi:hypothetical protein
MNEAFAIAQRESLTNRIQIFNATRGGYLEAFPRVDLDKILARSDSAASVARSA